MTSIRNWIIDVAHAFKYVPSEPQLKTYEEYIGRLKLTDAEMSSLRDQIIQEMDKFPAIAQIQEMGRSAARTKNKPDAAWMMYDRDGKRYASRLPGPAAHDDEPCLQADQGGHEIALEACRKRLAEMAAENGRKLKKPITAEQLLGHSNKAEGLEGIGSIIGRVLPNLGKPELEEKPKPEIDLLDDLEIPF